MEDKRTEKRIKGDLGEEIACRYLLRHGYSILDRNYYCKTGELDIVAFDTENRILSVVEVKTRKSVLFAYPSESVNEKKRMRIRKTASYYLIHHRQYRSFPVRLDVIEVILGEQGNYIRHIKNAF